MDTYDNIAGQVAIAGIAEADQSKASGRTAPEIAAQAVERAVADAGLSMDDVDGLMYDDRAAAPFDAEAFSPLLRLHPAVVDIGDRRWCGQCRHGPLSCRGRPPQP